MQAFFIISIRVSNPVISLLLLIIFTLLGLNVLMKSLAIDLTQIISLDILNPPQVLPAHALTSINSKKIIRHEVG